SESRPTTPRGWREPRRRSRGRMGVVVGMGPASARAMCGISARDSDILAAVMSERVVTSYKVLVGLEIHVQLATASKMFTAAPNGATNFGAEPNSLVDEVVLGLPGTLPVLNRKAVEYSIMVGLALGCKIAKHTKWDRKSYYYPDLPKNYQISQYDLPLCYDGLFEIPAVGEASLAAGYSLKTRIRREPLAEDAGKLLHHAPGGDHPHY